MANKQIASSGFYTVSELITNSTDISIDIGADTHVYLYDDSDVKLDITIGSNATLNYIGYFSKTGSYTKTFVAQGENATLNCKSLLFAKQNEIKSVIKGVGATNKTHLNMDIISFAENQGNISLDGILSIPENTSGVKGYLNEENIFLGTGGRIRGIPTLLVETNDMEASHACKIHKISDEKLFYLRSRGIEKTDATSMMVMSYVQTVIAELEGQDTEKYSEIIDDVFTKL